MDFKRIFLSCEIPGVVKEDIRKICQELKNLGFQLRFTPKENLHITLVFLPQVNSEQLKQISEIIKKVCSNFSQFHLFIKDLDAFPNLKLPKVVFVSLTGETGTLSNLATKIQHQLEKLNFGFSNSRFTPHITIARIKSYVGKVERKRLGETIQRWGKLEAFKIPGDAISIFESTPTSAGHIHTLLEKINLGK